MIIMPFKFYSNSRDFSCDSLGDFTRYDTISFGMIHKYAGYGNYMDFNKDNLENDEYPLPRKFKLKDFLDIGGFWNDYGCINFASPFKSRFRNQRSILYSKQGFRDFNYTENIITGEDSWNNCEKNIIHK